MFEKILKRFFWVPLGLGVVGYMQLGTMDIWHALYASAALYFVNPVTDEDNIAVLIAELLAIVVTTGVVLSLLGSAAKLIGRFFIRAFGDAAVVYGDAAYAGGIASTLRRGYYVEEPVRPENVATHIVCFADDEKTLRFYSNNKDKIASEDKNSYLILNTLDPFLLASTSEANVHILCVSDLVARRFWYEHDLYERVVHEKEDIRLAFVGEGRIAYSLVRYAYLNLIYTTSQNIEYNIFSVNPADNNYFAGLKPANADRIIIRRTGWESAAAEISEMTDVIVAFEKGSRETIDILQQLLRQPSPPRIYVYSEDDTDYADLFEADRLVTFGNIGGLLTEDFIINEPLDRAAKLFNYDYTLRATSKSAPDNYMDEAEKEWRSLNGFFRGSNIARADHHFIERRLYEDGIPEEEIEEVEHIRWCRYYYANGWEYDPVRDNSKKKHHLLVPFDELSDAEKGKDGIYDDELKAEIERLCV